MLKGIEKSDIFTEAYKWMGMTNFIVHNKISMLAIIKLFGNILLSRFQLENKSYPHEITNELII